MGLKVEGQGKNVMRLLKYILNGLMEGLKTMMWLLLYLIVSGVCLVLWYCLIEGSE